MGPTEFLQMVFISFFLYILLKVVAYLLQGNKFFFLFNSDIVSHY